MTETVYSARQASARLGLSAAMTRRYGATLEEVTGQRIPQHPRDGRQYSTAHLETMERAKGFIETNPRISVVQALQLALGEGPTVEAPVVSKVQESSAQALSDALEQALARSLLPELRALREEVTALRSELATLKALPRPERGQERTVESAVPEAAAPPRTTGGASDGLLVRVARWIERRVRGDA